MPSRWEATGHGELARGRTVSGDCWVLCLHRRQLHCRYLGYRPKRRRNAIAPITPAPIATTSRTPLSVNDSTVTHTDIAPTWYYPIASATAAANMGQYMTCSLGD